VATRGHKKRTNAGRPLRRSSRMEVCCRRQRLRSAEWHSAMGFRYLAGSVDGRRQTYPFEPVWNLELEAVGLDRVGGELVAEVRVGNRDQPLGALAEALAEEFGDAEFGHDIADV
jgi:hypothetical protein